MEWLIVMCSCRYGSVNMMDMYFFFQAEDGIRDLVRSRGLGDVYKRQDLRQLVALIIGSEADGASGRARELAKNKISIPMPCLLYTSDAADERSSVDLGGRRIIKKKTSRDHSAGALTVYTIYNNVAIRLTSTIRSKTKQQIASR